MLDFIRRHWAASLAILLATLTTAAVVALAIAFPPAILAVAGLTAFGFTPFAFLASLSTAYAVAALGAITFAASLTMSSLWNAAVAVYNLLDKAITPAPAHNPNPEEEISLIDVEDSPEEAKGPSVWSKLFPNGCCGKPEEKPVFPPKHTTLFGSEPLDTATPPTFNPSSTTPTHQ
ncbi:hypothetical protein [Legionella jordanis]|uniref:Transmembrane protein n=1 Tax=Legionella jordanis TaxID=456 RepID=A0A0W0VCF4_9GAMM|nr:hypothetical protein [Legionella jordanis]KTD17813.1 hypothetical protein Ljor_2119 [Legionella jordanis]RMX02484.1 hypothetical protein EAW55_09570 [Legionella jordanis]RMX21673.1 hypothetical protein EAS68_02650 [Legionella jordanis]VEH11250.1 Uncharacterised protein [Legionella jordanis]HAT8713782.1 hypothetical protein [Legionella jordanis]